MRERESTTDESSVRRVRTICYSYAVLWAWCAPLFIIDMMDVGYEIVALGFLLALPICIVVGLETLAVVGRMVIGRGCPRGPLAPLTLALMAASVAVHACWPNLHIQFFFWRHAGEFQRIVDRQQESSRVARYPSGTVIWYRWRTISDQAIAFVHEPGRRPGDGILAQEVTPLGGAFDLHLGGAWYAARY